jgi:uncharacterized protein YlxW (UPF0749 family)
MVSTEMRGWGITIKHGALIAGTKCCLTLTLTHAVSQRKVGAESEGGGEEREVNRREEEQEVNRREEEQEVESEQTRRGADEKRSKKWRVNRREEEQTRRGARSGE